MRTPDEREGDLTAQIAANRVRRSGCARRSAKYGADQRRLGMPPRCRTTPSVCCGARSPHAGWRIRVRGRARRRRLQPTGGSRSAWPCASAATRREVDFTGSDPQTDGGVNANFAITLSASLYAFRCLVRDDVLYNDGIVAAADGHRAGGHDRQRAAAGGGRGRQRRDLAAHHRRAARRARQALPDRDPGREPGDDEQRDARRRRSAQRAGDSRTTRRSAAAWAAARACPASAACTRT